jgi:hypothetical protein
LDRPIDFDEEREFSIQDPLTDIDMDEDAQILGTFLKHIPSCMNAADIEQQLQDITVRRVAPPTVVGPVRTMQESVAAGDLPPLDVNAANVFSQSELSLQEHVRKYGTNAAELQDLIQRVLHYLDV